MKKILSILLAMVLVIGLFAGCGADSVSGGAYDAGNGDALYGEGYETPAEGGAVADTEQKLIKKVSMDVETEELDALLSSLDNKIAALGGYIESRNVYNGGAYSSGSRYATMTVRIPAGELDRFVEQVEEASNIVSSKQTVDNVTLTYVATESRMKALQAEEERLLELMEQAATMSDLLEVESRLTEVRTELESVTSSLRVLENQVSYATVTLSIDEVLQFTTAEKKNPFQRMGEGFVESLKDLGNGIVEFAVFVVAKLPYLVLIGAIAALAVILARRKPKKQRKNSQPPFPVEDQKPE